MISHYITLMGLAFFSTYTIFMISNLIGLVLSGYITSELIIIGKVVYASINLFLALILLELAYG